MIYDRIKYGTVDYCLYRFGKSKQLYRGPRPDLSKNYCAFIGATETYGKFVKTPFAGLLRNELGVQCANFGKVNAGIDQYAKDPAIQVACTKAKATVITVMGAHNLSNRFYTVHPRRNDRFLQASGLLRTLYREVDFSEIHYTRHLLKTLRDADTMKFTLVVEELKAAWVARMKLLLDLTKSETILFWMSDHAPNDVFNSSDSDDDFASDPLFVDQQMIDQISPLVAQVVECVVSPNALTGGEVDMVFSKGEERAAKEMFSPLAHEEAAQALAEPLKLLL